MSNLKWAVLVARQPLVSVDLPGENSTLFSSTSIFRGSTDESSTQVLWELLNTREHSFLGQLCWSHISRNLWRGEMVQRLILLFPDTCTQLLQGRGWRGCRPGKLWRKPGSPHAACDLTNAKADRIASVSGVYLAWKCERISCAGVAPLPYHRHHYQFSKTQSPWTFLLFRLGCVVFLCQEQSGNQANGRLLASRLLYKHSKPSVRQHFCWVQICESLWSTRWCTCSLFSTGYAQILRLPNSMAI